MATEERITSAKLFDFHEYLLSYQNNSEMKKENCGLDVLVVFGAKIRNLSKKKGNGFHIQGSQQAQMEAEQWLSAYHYESLRPTLFCNVVDDFAALD